MASRSRCRRLRRGLPNSRAVQASRATVEVSLPGECRRRVAVRGGRGRAWWSWSCAVVAVVRGAILRERALDALTAPVAREAAVLDIPPASTAFLRWRLPADLTAEAGPCVRFPWAPTSSRGGSCGRAAAEDAQARRICSDGEAGWRGLLLRLHGASRCAVDVLVQNRSPCHRQPGAVEALHCVLRWSDGHSRR